MNSTIPPVSDRRAVGASRVMRLLTDSRPKSLESARRQVSQTLARAGLGPDAALEMEIATGEILSNTHLHAYPSGTGPVFVEVFCAAGSVAVIVIDHGTATAAVAVPAGQPSFTRYGGRGLYLIGELTDKVKIRVSGVGHGLAVLIAKSFEHRQTLAA
jgi:anti-sigma regulatory factor (Ser/Thr protein kinase)